MDRSPAQIRVDALHDIANVTRNALDIVMVLTRSLGDPDGATREEVSAFAHVASLAQIDLENAVKKIEAATAAAEAALG